MTRIVLDTNVLISGLNFPQSKPSRILELVAAGEVLNFISEPIIAEAERILADKFLWDREEIEAAVFWLKTFSHLVIPKIRRAVITDGPDNRILECAVTGNVEFLVSGDKHLLNLKTYRTIQIINPLDFLEKNSSSLD